MENIWYSDPIKYLTSPSYLTKFIPENNMKIEEQLNAIIRFSIYFCIVVFIIKHDFKVFIILVVILVASIILYQIYIDKDTTKNSIMEHLNISTNKSTDTYCTKPTKDNPFMNVMYNDYRKFPNRPPACMNNKKEAKEMIDKYFNENYNRSTDDVFEKDGGSRQFYTNPSTTIPNDQDTFAKWLYTPNLIYKNNNSMQ